MNKSLKPGLSVIELVIGLMISSILLTATLTIYNQISKSCNKIQSLTSQDLAVMIFQKRLSDDLLGLCPLWFKSEDIKSGTQAKTPEQKNSSLKENNYFYAQSQDEQIDFMTFISANTLQAYPAPENYIARIVYILKKDSHKPDFFILQRKEESQISNEFDIEKLKEGKFYTIVENVKKCKLEYGFAEKSDNKNEKKSDKEFKIKWVQQWSKEKEEKKDATDKNEEQPNLPDVIRITLTLQEFSYKPETLHVFYCLLPQSKNISIGSLAQKRNQKTAKETQNNLSSANTIMNRIQNAAQQNIKGIAHA